MRIFTDEKLSAATMKIGIRKRILNSIRDTAVCGINERMGASGLAARIHRMVLSGDRHRRSDYGWNVLKNVFDGKLWLNEHYEPEDRGRNYARMYIHNRSEFQVNVLCAPTSGYLPPVQIEIHPRRDVTVADYKKLLIWLNASLAGLFPSTIECAVDQFCDSSFDVENLYWVECYSIYVPFQQQEPRAIGGQQIAEAEGVSFDRRGTKALIWNIGEKDKIYERGNDNDKEGESWDYEKLNRVRLEHTADRRELRRKGLRWLTDLIDDPKFYELNKNLWKFRRFKETSSEKRTQEWQPEGGPFQVLLKKLKLKNPTQYDEPVEELAELELRIAEAMRFFDDQWRKVEL